MSLFIVPVIGHRRSKQGPESCVSCRSNHVSEAVILSLILTHTPEITGLRIDSAWVNIAPAQYWVNFLDYCWVTGSKQPLVLAAEVNLVLTHVGPIFNPVIFLCAVILCVKMVQAVHDAPVNIKQMFIVSCGITCLLNPLKLFLLK